MKVPGFVALLALALLSPLTAAAQRPALPPILTRAFALLEADSLEASTRLWVGTLTSPSDSARIETILSWLQRTREFAGAFRGYDVINTELVSPHLMRTYVLMVYERQPVYGQVVMYNPGSDPPGWHVQSVTWNTDPAKAWPSTLWTH